MTPERFRQIEELYHAARAASPDERAGLLDQADAELRREVESLLAKTGGEFIDRPAIQNAPELLADLTKTLFVAGALLGPYRIDRKLAEGGMGEVFRAIDTRLGRSVAIKTTREQFSARFEREARVISSLNHPNICTLHDVGPNYLVMELVEGETIAAALKRGPVPQKIALSYASQILAALAEAHDKGIVHRDLKPSNIMIAKSGIKVLDFGLAKSGGDESLTESRMVMGTPAYMAPEQREGKPADTRSDIYSFGCVLYEMLTGARAPLGKRIASGKLEKIVSRCLEQDPGQRWQSAAELARELAAVNAGNRWKIALSAAAAVVLLSGAAYFYAHREAKLTDRDTIVLADFVNNTGDPIFDGTLREGLAIQLEQSPFLKVMDDEVMQRVARLMNLPRGTRISNPTAHEICVRQGAAATIDGSIASLGKNYVITLEAVNCRDGTTLARQQVQAEDKEHVLNAVGTAAMGLRHKLGETLDSVQKLNRPLDEVTTSSLEALQSFTTGREISQRAGTTLAAIAPFERAVAIDPNFAEAYYFMGISYEVAGDMARSREYATQAFRLVDRVSERERTEITAYYYRATGELDKEINAWRLGVHNYPRIWYFHNQLGLIYVDDGQYEEGLTEGLEAARIEPNVEPSYRRQLDAYICLDRLAEAKQLGETVRKLGVDGARIHQRFLEIAYVEEDQAAISREIQWFTGKPEEYLSFGLQAANLNMRGQRHESHQLYQRAAETARRQGLRDAASEFEDADARADALAGNCQTVRQLGRPALALAICGDAALAEKLAAETSKLFPNGTIWNSVQLPEIRAAIALQRGEPAESVELLASAAPYERSYIEVNYLRGFAYLQLHKGAEAAAEFRKIVDHKGASWGATWIHPNWAQYYALSLLGLARAYALADDNTKAQQAFQSFFELWKNADPDVAIFRQAKTEYAQLK